MKKIDTLIFDLDGTLLDTIEDITDSVNYILNHHNYPAKSLNEVKKNTGNGMKRLIELCVPQGLGDDEIDNLFEELKLYYTAHSDIKTKLYPGILEMLAYLKNEGYKMAIVSNKNHAAVLELTELYFGDYIKTAIGQAEGIRRKPYADSVYTALAELDSVCDKAVYIGDSEVDIKTAQNANMRCVIVSWGFRERQHLLDAGAEIIIDRAEEMISLLQEDFKKTAKI